MSLKVVVISSANKSASEIDYLVKFLDQGADYFHVKKKSFSKKKMKKYIEMVPPKYRSRLVLHSHFRLAVKYKVGGVHLNTKNRKKRWLNYFRLPLMKLMYPKLFFTASFHSIQSMKEARRRYAYVFLSPIFDIHNMSDFSAAFSPTQLQKTLKKSKQNVIALGGVKEDKIPLAIRTGFCGVALHGVIWREKTHRLKRFAEVMEVAAPFKTNFS